MLLSIPAAVTDTQRASELGVQPELSWECFSSAEGAELNQTELQLQDGHSQVMEGGSQLPSSLRNFFGTKRGAEEMQIRRGYLGSDQCQLALKGSKRDPAAPLVPTGFWLQAL